MANTLNLLRNGAVGFIDWLDGWRAITQDHRRGFGELSGDSEDAAEAHLARQ